MKFNINTGLKFKLIVVPTLILMVLTTTIVMSLNKQLSEVVIQDSLRNAQNVTKMINEAVSQMIDMQIHDVIEDIYNTSIEDPNLTDQERLKTLELFVNPEYAGSVVSFADIQGKTMATNNMGYIDLSESKQFQHAIRGEVYYSSPVVDRQTGDFSYSISVPVHNMYDRQEIIGVYTYTYDAAALSILLDKLDYGEVGEAYILDENGAIIAYKDIEFAKQLMNCIENAKTIGSDVELSKIHQVMINGEEGIEQYRNDEGRRSYLVYEPINSKSEWSLGLRVEEDAILSMTKKISGYVKYSLLGMVIILGMSLYIILKRAITRLSILQDYITNMSSGNLSQVPKESMLKGKDEIAEVWKALFATQQAIKNIIDDTKNTTILLQQEGNQLGDTAEIMSENAKNIAIAINGTAEGCQQQTDNMVTISTQMMLFEEKIIDLGVRVKESEQSAEIINDKADFTQKELIILLEKAERVMDTFKVFEANINHMSTSLKEVDSITKVIDGISEQTNLLALNAAIEAARVGESGRGFAVVANEIRILAEESKKSASEIKGILNRVGNESEIIVSEAIELKEGIIEQNTIIQKSEESFIKILQEVSQMVSNLDNMSNAFEYMNVYKGTVIGEIEISQDISQDIAATSEEIAASTEEFNEIGESIYQSSQVLRDVMSNLEEKLEFFR